MSSDLEDLETERQKLYHELSDIGDFRRGSIVISYRRCGKPNCACINPEHPGHGPQYLLTTKVSGKTQTKVIRPGPELLKTEREIDNHSHFQELAHQLIEINELICNIRPAQAYNPDSTEAETEATAKKGASKTGSKRKS